MSEPAIMGEEAGVPVEALQAVAISRLCKTCKHASKPIARSWDAAECLRPGLPINLVSGEQRFPCIIARGYQGLCGALGVFWVKR